MKNKLCGLKLYIVTDNLGFNEVVVYKNQWNALFSNNNVLNCSLKKDGTLQGNNFDLRKLPRFNKFGKLVPNLKSLTVSEIVCNVLNIATSNNINDFAYRICGALVSGAITDTYSKEAIRHSELYYSEIRAMTTDVGRIAKNTGFSESQILLIKQYLFLHSHILSSGIKRFDASFEIAQSWQRLMSKDKREIKPHDITLLNHELYEMQLVSQGCEQNKAHLETCKKYNYPRESEAYYDSIRKHK